MDRIPGRELPWATGLAGGGEPIRLGRLFYPPVPVRPGIYSIRGREEGNPEVDVLTLS